MGKINIAYRSQWLRRYIHVEFLFLVCVFAFNGTPLFRKIWTIVEYSVTFHIPLVNMPNQIFCKLYFLYIITSNLPHLLQTFRSSRQFLIKIALYFRETDFFGFALDKSPSILYNQIRHRWGPEKRLLAAERLFMVQDSCQDFSSRLGVSAGNRGGFSPISETEWALC